MELHWEQNLTDFLTSIFKGDFKMSCFEDPWWQSTGPRKIIAYYVSSAYSCIAMKVLTGC